jgi:hypothetical protein
LRYHSPIREGACKVRGGDSTRYSTHSNRSANAPTKTLGGLRSQPLTSEHYCPRAAVRDDRAALHGATGYGVRREKEPEPLHRESVRGLANLRPYASGSLCRMLYADFREDLLYWLRLVTFVRCDMLHQSASSGCCE